MSFLFGQPFEVLLFHFPGDLRGGSGPEKPSRIPRYGNERFFFEIMDTCIPFLTELQNFRSL